MGSMGDDDQAGQLLPDWRPRDVETDQLRLAHRNLVEQARRTLTELTLVKCRAMELQELLDGLEDAARQARTELERREL